MRVDHVLTSINEQASGPSHSVPALCEAVGAQGVDVRLHVLAPSPEREYAHMRLLQYPRWPVIPRLAASAPMRRSLREAAGSADILHNHGLWEMPNVYSDRATRRTRCRLINSPRGSLIRRAMSRSPWLKKVMWTYGQGRAIRASACLHATSEAECDEIRQLGFRMPVSIVPNGIDIPERPSGDLDPRFNGRRRLLFLGRIHPIKGVDILLRSWRALQESFPEWDLELVGPDNVGYLAQMRELAQALGVERVEFRGSLFGDQKNEAFRHASLFVLPTQTENFGMAVAEALASGVPAIVTKGAPWEGLEANGCGWWIDHGEGALTDCLRTALALSPETLRQHGERGREWMKRDFSWDRVGRMMHATYLWVLGGGTPPDWVRRVD